MPRQARQKSENGRDREPSPVHIFMFWRVREPSIYCGKICKTITKTDALLYGICLDETPLGITQWTVSVKT